jgi:hypothetical protein
MIYSASYLFSAYVASDELKNKVKSLKKEAQKDGKNKYADSITLYEAAIEDNSLLLTSQLMTNVA